MRSLNLGFLTYLCFNFSFYSYAQITFQKTFGGFLDDYGFEVQQTTDGGYIIAGYTTNSGAGHDLYLIKTNPFGESIWIMTIGGLYYEEAHSVKQTLDGGYIITGVNILPPHGAVYLVKTDASGDTVWTKAYRGGGGSSVGEEVIQTADSGYVIVGTKSTDVYLMKTNQNGEILWTKNFGGSDWDASGRSVQQTFDGGYIIAGSKFVIANNNNDIYIIKTNAIGDTLWTKTFGGNGEDAAWSAKQASNSGYIVTGFITANGQTVSDIYLFKTNSDGDTLWTKTFISPGDNVGYSVQQTTDGGYIVVCRKAYDVHLIKTNGNGDVLWTRTFDDNGLSVGFCVQQTIDSGYVITGATWDPVYNYFDVLLIKTDDLGIVTQTSAEEFTSTSFILYQNYPNPFNPVTQIDYNISNTSYVVLRVYDIMGQLITTLVDGLQSEGQYEVQWQAKDLPSGIYLYRLEAGGFSETKKLLLLK
jgi:hypothetical protein